MPRKNKKRKFLPKRYKGYKKQNKKNMSKLILYRNAIVPDSMYLRFKYNETVLKTTLFQDHVFSLNGMFDPNVTGTGVQPLGFDQWAAFYTQYQVLSSSIKVVTVNNSGAVPAATIVYPSHVVTAATNLQMATEQPYSRRTVQQVNTSNSVKTIKNYMSVRKIEGRSTDSVNFTALFSANPSAQRFWHVVTGSLNESSAANQFIDVTIVYYAKLFRRHTLTES